MADETHTFQAEIFDTDGNKIGEMPFTVNKTQMDKLAQEIIDSPWRPYRGGGLPLPERLREGLDVPDDRDLDRTPDEPRKS